MHVPINVCYTAVLRAPVPRRGERGERHRIRNSAVSYPDPTRYFDLFDRESCFCFANRNTHAHIYTYINLLKKKKKKRALALEEEKEQVLKPPFIIIIIIIIICYIYIALF